MSGSRTPQLSPTRGQRPMTHTAHAPRLLRYLILGSLVIAACSKGDDTAPATGAAKPPAATSQSVDEELADLASYRLTMDKFDKYFAAQRNIMMKAKDMSPEQKAAMKQR